MSPPATPPATPPARRHRAFPAPPSPWADDVSGPPTQLHSDACIRDAARFGFCNHTRLVASSRLIQAQRAYDRHLLARTTRRELLATLAFTLLVVYTAWLVHLIGLLALPLIALSGIGWLLVFTCGLPAWLTADLSKALPEDTRARLNADLDIQQSARRARRKWPFRH